MSKIVKHNEFKKVVNGLWSKVKENFVTEVKYDATSKKLKYAKNSGETEITKVVTEWTDLEHVKKYSVTNLVDYAKRRNGIKFNNDGQNTENNSDYGLVSFNVNGNQDYTLLRHRANHLRVRLDDVSGNLVQFIDMPTSIRNGWNRAKFTTPQNASVATLELYVKQSNEKDVMILEGDQLNLSVNSAIPFTDNKTLQIEKEISYAFDNSNSNINSQTVESAIKELGNKIANASGGTVTRVNGQDPDAQGEVTVGIADINGLQDTLNSKVVTVNQQQPQQGGNVTLNGTHISATIGSNTTSIQEHLRLIGIKANDNDTRLIKLERKHPTYNVGDIVPTFKNSGSSYRVDGCEFMYCGVANSLNRTQYPDFCDVLGYPTNTARYDTPVIRDETVVIGNGKSVTKRYYICIKNS